MRPRPLSRRAMLQALAAGGALAPLGRPARAASAADRKFVFLMCTGGWDTSFALTPTFDSPNFDMPENSFPDEVNGIPFVDSPERPSVRAWLERWGDQACLVHGMEVRSVTHERCRQLVLTGSGEGGVDDWPATLASGGGSLLLPHLVIAGPAYTSAWTSNVVRVGDAAQLPQLLDGSALTSSTTPLVTPSSATESLEDAFVRARAADLLERAGGGQERSFASRYVDALDHADALGAYQGELDLEVVQGSCERNLVADFSIALDVLSLGLGRCAMLRYNGWCDEGWDTHQGLELQGRNFEDLFAYLDAMMEELAGRTSASGAPLADEVTLVVFSEMGRHPRLNSWGGKDHWTFTSCMLVGSGVRGGQALGGLDDSAQGLAIDLDSGEASSAGTSLLPGHLGGTLLALGDMDPGEHSSALDPITAAMR